MIDPKFKIIADHLRSSSFLIMDGIIPGNEGRSYVLRRILRRAMLQIHKLGINKPIMYKYVESLSRNMSQHYPELNKKKEYIQNIIKDEELKFNQTLSNGLKIINDELLSNNNKLISGNIAFKLYDTYGFPLDLTQDILRENNRDVNINEFNQAMSMQKNRAKNSLNNININDLAQYFASKENIIGSTEFTGYNELINECKIIDISIINGQEFIILNKTPFYATSGGQRGDKGIITSYNPKNVKQEKYTNYYKISETKKFGNNIYVHIVETKKGNLNIGDKVYAMIDNQNRQALAQGHSATHLLHKALKLLIDENISQKGSSIEAQYLTFDYNYNKPLTNNDIYKIEDLINFYIRKNDKVKTDIMKLDKAVNKGAIAMFDSQYEEDVRVLEIGDSLELCGGTHVEFSGNIGIFKIISDSSIASGIRRILAKVGSNAYDYLRCQDIKIKAIEKALNISIDNNYKNDKYTKSGFIDSFCIDNNLDLRNEYNLENELNNQYNIKGNDLIKTIKDKDKEIDNLKKELIISKLITRDLQNISDINILFTEIADIDAKQLREISNDIINNKKFTKSSIIILYNISNNKIIITIKITNDLLVKYNACTIFKAVSPYINAKGGGSQADFAMGGGDNIDGINNIKNNLVNIINNA